ncbi:AAA family ATPase [Prevotella denticola]
MLYRKIGEFISSHLQTPDGKILLIDGARQIGKSYIIRHIDQKKFKNYIELNMEEDICSQQALQCPPGICSVQ